MLVKPGIVWISFTKMLSASRSTKKSARAIPEQWTAEQARSAIRIIAARVRSGNSARVMSFAPSGSLYLAS